MILEFSHTWNGISLIPPQEPSHTFVVDTSGSGIGGSDGLLAYGGQVAPIADPAVSIAELKVANIVMAIHTFLSN